MSHKYYLSFFVVVVVVFVVVVVLFFISSLFIPFSDIDECKDENGGCPHFCVNTPGSYICHCRDGYVTENNGTVCRPREYKLNKIACLSLSRWHRQSNSQNWRVILKTYSFTLMLHGFYIK